MCYYFNVEEDAKHCVKVILLRWKHGLKQLYLCIGACYAHFMQTKIPIYGSLCF